jgi:nicotinamidase/pyrazinamidase
MKALLVVDLQNDFMPKGALGVKKADEIVPLINKLMEKFPLVVASKDWHPKGHSSFASSHPGKKIGDVIKIEGAPQVLWPVHCVQETPGSEFVSSLNQKPIARVFYKGTDPKIDGYSAFYDNARKKSTGLTDYLKQHKVTEVYIAGLTTDYCVVYSALDALEDGFEVVVIQDACRGINLHPQDVENALAAIAARDGKIIFSRDLK